VRHLAIASGFRKEVAFEVLTTAKNAMVRMTPQPDSGEVLAGLVERVTYHNAENGFCVLRARARGHRDVVTVVGHSPPRLLLVIEVAKLLPAAVLHDEAGV
jgi:hypothetical protein